MGVRDGVRVGARVGARSGASLKDEPSTFWQFSRPKLYFGLSSFHFWMKPWLGLGLG